MTPLLNGTRRGVLSGAPPVAAPPPESPPPQALSSMLVGEEAPLPEAMPALRDTVASWLRRLLVGRE